MHSKRTWRMCKAEKIQQARGEKYLLWSCPPPSIPLRCISVIYWNGHCSAERCTYPNKWQTITATRGKTQSAWWMNIMVKWCGILCIFWAFCCYFPRFNAAIQYFRQIYYRSYCIRSLFMEQRLNLWPHCELSAESQHFHIQNTY